MIYAIRNLNDLLSLIHLELLSSVDPFKLWALKILNIWYLHRVYQRPAWSITLVYRLVWSTKNVKKQASSSYSSSNSTNGRQLPQQKQQQKQQQHNMQVRIPTEANNQKSHGFVSVTSCSSLTPFITLIPKAPCLS